MCAILDITLKCSGYIRMKPEAGLKHTTCGIMLRSISEFRLRNVALKWDFHIGFPDLYKWNKSDVRLFFFPCTVSVAIKH